MTQLARQFAEHPEVRYGLTAMCIGIGMGGTVIWENPALGGREVTHSDNPERGRHQGAACAWSRCPGSTGRPH